jgi:hypothetical protein
MLKNPLLETTAKVIDTATEPLAALIPEMLARGYHRSDQKRN